MITSFIEKRNYHQHDASLIKSIKRNMRFSIFFVFFFGMTCSSISGQGRMGDIIQLRCDSILNLLVQEKDPDRKADLILSFYATSIDGFPLQLLVLSQKLLDLSRKNNDVFSESAALSAAGQAYRITGSYVKALELHRQALAVAEKSGNKILIGFALNQMAHIYKDRLENDKALALYYEALRDFRDAGREDIWFPSMNLGVVYYNMGNNDSALYYSYEGLRKIYNTPGSGNQSAIFSNIAGIYSKKNFPDSVRKYFKLALNLAYSTQSPRYMNGTCIAIAEHFSRHGQQDSAAFYFKKAVEVVTGTEMNTMVLKPALKLTEYYQNINPDSTVKYWKVYSAANDSINSLRANQQIQMLTFEEEQRKRDIESAQSAYRNSVRTRLLLGGLAVFLLAAIVLFRNNRQKQKSNAKLEKTVAELKATQSQLIQSEKMASLGELTAGIAHEIQNPLNFVNNFSELSNELISEMVDEVERGNTGEVKAIAKDVQQNLEKILHHGKRADAIVKGMLQHSRAGSGQKEPTDINALCDEYIRLAYHGLRAKDKSFNANFETRFDEGIGKINVLPQDMGRVILNLINNAFYAVSERKKLAEQGYDPMVTIATRKLGDRVEISVKDNGTGIPQSILDKIFQPFYTTKPTGQGTGLGLSLSYDIVKAHGGELKVDTKENEGSTFIIQLPTA
ncbi:MAG TPA: ATP-binding protein [Chitinophagaceae bacterium]|jgi:signal transduction histidine kinase|nr:ATP-binding protein [Chitinophagaceae bacterium]HRG92794.1 ATP-binding protein [Chitinophagaceae bacterium]